MIAELVAINSAYAVVKTAIGNGAEIGSIANKIGKWVGLVEQAESQHRKERSRKGASSGELEEALSTWQTVKAIKEQETDLKNLIIAQTGNMNAWNEIVQIRTNLRKEKLAKKKKAENRRRQISENIQTFSMIVILVIIVMMVVTFGILLMQKYN